MSTLLILLLNRGAGVGAVSMGPSDGQLVGIRVLFGWAVGQDSSVGIAVGIAVVCIAVAVAVLVCIAVGTSVGIDGDGPFSCDGSFDSSVGIAVAVVF